MLNGPSPYRNGETRMLKRLLQAFGFILLAAALSFGQAAPGPSGAASAQAVDPAVIALRDAYLVPLQAQYLAGVADAQATLAHLKNPPANPDIWDITAGNPNLIWNGTPGASQVLVATFTKAQYYATAAPGQTLTAVGDYWVTPAPQAYTAIKAASPGGVVANPTLALDEYLGLPPTSTDDAVVSMWVSPANLVRPAMDPSITNHAAETDFPLSGQVVPVANPAALPKQPPAPGFGPAADYPTWFLERESAIYNPSIPGGPYPWTGLGYTYNWGNLGVGSVVGGSEFVIPQGSPVKIQAVTPVSAYFN